MSRSLSLIFALVSAASCHASCDSPSTGSAGPSDAAVLGAPRGIQRSRGVMMRPMFRRDLRPVTTPSSATPPAQPR